MRYAPTTDTQEKNGIGIRLQRSQRKKQRPIFFIIVERLELTWENDSLNSAGEKAKFFLVVIRMPDQQKLIEKFIKIQALFNNAGTEGEKEAAFAAMGRIKDEIDKNKNMREQEFQFSFDNPWSRTLFIALLRKNKIEPFRRHRQKRSTVMAKIKSEFCKNVLWPEFLKLNDELNHFLSQTAQEIIRKAVNSNFSEPIEVN